MAFPGLFGRLMGRVPDSRRFISLRLEPRSAPATRVSSITNEYTIAVCVTRRSDLLGSRSSPCDDITSVHLRGGDASGPYHVTILAMCSLLFATVVWSTSLMVSTIRTLWRPKVKAIVLCNPNHARVGELTTTGNCTVVIHHTRE